ncbi:MAG: response regulator [Acidimicrobiales bacterium]|jgi:diguanylate cyclase (GGDEF)-like protein|nr:response regulator [Acidimicrobiales bacterium]HLV89566.1 response regulator [Acidimicrobiia bacterium]
MSERVLVADDDADILAVVKINFELDGFEVETAVDGEDALQKATANPPNAIVLDIMMPRMDGLTALHRLRSQATTANIPIILLTARGLPEDRVRGLELGADDYITKPFDITELAARVRAVLRRTQAARDLSPLTGLPGNFKITAEIEARIRDKEPFALIHGDLDNFKAFNDHYGFMRGDEVIRFCARCFTEAAQTLDLGDQSFIGHIGGDDFVAITPPDMAEAFCKEVTERFDDGILDLYDTADALRGYIEVIDRRGERYAFPVVSLSLGVASTDVREITSQWEASAIAVEMKEFAKKQPGSTYRIDRRSS